MESLGQIKLSITSNQNLRALAYQNPVNASVIRENSPIKDKTLNPLRESFTREMTLPNLQNPYSMSFAREPSFQPPSALSQTQQQIQFRFNEVNLDLTDKEDDELKLKHLKNLSDLDSLISTLKRDKLGGNEPRQRDEEEQKLPFPYQPNNPFGFTVGHNQSQDLKSQLNNFSQKFTTNPFQQQFQGSLGGAVLEQDHENSEFDRENEERDRIDHQNVFQHDKG